jgi:hypothetical protein
VSPLAVVLLGWLVISLAVAGLVARAFAAGCANPQHHHAATDRGDIRWHLRHN